VDFSGARLAGRTLWVARARRAAGRLRLVDLFRVEDACGSPERDRALPFLVDLIRNSEGALWAIDAPFGLPVEILDAGMSWPGLLRFARSWKDGGYALGLWCVRRARALGGPLHIYRPADRAARTPFDCYHYRIIYQTFHALRDVLWPLHRSRGTAIVPFQYHRLPSARRVVFETCPSSTLKRLGLPHLRYKQPRGGPVSADRRVVRRRILDGLRPFVTVTPALWKRAVDDPGGDALDAIVAAVGGWSAWRRARHAQIARDARARREGFLYV
jgi:hypothetical protein